MAKKGIKMFEVVNSPLFHAGYLGTLNPYMDLKESVSEKYFREVLDDFKPDIIHIQELAGLPSSLVDIIKEYSIPMVMTLHNYYLLCPKVNLFKFDNKNCVENLVGKNCLICCSNAPNNNRNLIFDTLIYTLKKYNLCFLIKLMHPIMKLVKCFHFKKQTDKKIDLNANKLLSSEYQRRRNLNLERLRKVDLLISQSYKVEKIYQKYLKSNNILTLHSTVKHFELIKPKNMEKIEVPIKFGTLNGCSSIQKGSQLILKTLKILKLKNLDQKFQFHIFGGIDEEIVEILDFKNVYYHGPYDFKDLNSILEEIDVGIISSVWEEIFGYVGLEFLAKGIPIIGNNKGGITDYTKENFTGWINKSSSPEELANIMEEIIKNSHKVSELNGKINENRDLILKNMDEHLKEIEKIYKKCINKNLRI